MRRAITIVTACMFVGLASMPAWGANPHYLKLGTNLDTGTACYSVDLKEAGLGNSGVTEVKYTLACTDVTFTDVCVTKNGKNFVQGQPKSGTTDLTGQTTLPV